MNKNKRSRSLNSTTSDLETSVINSPTKDAEKKEIKKPKQDKKKVKTTGENMAQLENKIEEINQKQTQIYRLRMWRLPWRHGNPLTSEIIYDPPK